MILECVIVHWSRLLNTCWQHFSTNTVTIQKHHHRRNVTSYRCFSRLQQMLPNLIHLIYFYSCSPICIHFHPLLFTMFIHFHPFPCSVHHGHQGHHGHHSHHWWQISILTQVGQAVLAQSPNAVTATMTTLANATSTTNQLIFVIVMTLVKDAGSDKKWPIGQLCPGQSYF